MYKHTKTETNTFCLTEFSSLLASLAKLTRDVGSSIA